MEAIAGILFATYAAFYGILWIVYFFNPKPLKKWLRYSTIGLIVLVIFLIISLFIDGTLFKDIQVINYF